MIDTAFPASWYLHAPSAHLILPSLWACYLTVIHHRGLNERKWVAVVVVQHRFWRTSPNEINKLLHLHSHHLCLTCTAGCDCGRLTVPSELMAFFFFRKAPRGSIHSECVLTSWPLWHGTSRKRDEALRQLGNKSMDSKSVKAASERSGVASSMYTGGIYYLYECKYS